jgi:hypothetical protein
MIKAETPKHLKKTPESELREELKLKAIVDALVEQLDNGKWEKLGLRETLDASQGLRHLQIRLLERHMDRLGIDYERAELYP